jgi:hypothetical protein
MDIMKTLNVSREPFKEAGTNGVSHRSPSAMVEEKATYMRPPQQPTHSSIRCFDSKCMNDARGNQAPWQHHPPVG